MEKVIGRLQAKNTANSKNTEIVAINKPDYSKKRDTFILYHAYDYGKEKEHTEMKILGVYSSRKKAKEAIERYRHLEGFCDYPKKCFQIDEYNIDYDMWWNEGFCSSN